MYVNCSTNNIRKMKKEYNNPKIRVKELSHLCLGIGSEPANSTDAGAKDVFFQTLSDNEDSNDNYEVVE